MKPAVDPSSAVHITQLRTEGGASELFPWPSAYASAQSAKSALRKHIDNMAHHNGLEEAPKLEWAGNKSKPISFGTKQYIFEIRDPGRHTG